MYKINIVELNNGKFAIQRTILFFFKSYYDFHPIYSIQWRSASSYWFKDCQVKSFLEAQEVYNQISGRVVKRTLNV